MTFPYEVDGFRGCLIDHVLHGVRGCLIIDKCVIQAYVLDGLRGCLIDKCVT